MGFKLLHGVQKHRKRIKGFKKLELVVHNVQFRNTEQVADQSDRAAARAAIYQTPMATRKAAPSITRLHGYYGWLRLPRTTACVLALTLVRRCPPPADRCADLPGYHALSMSGSTRPRTPGSTHATRQNAARIVACRRDKPVGTLQRKTFRGSTPSRSASPVTFAPRLLSCLRIDTAVTTRAARLDTGLAAHDYPGGTLTR